MTNLDPALQQALTTVLLALAGLFVAVISAATLRFTQWINAKKQDTQWGTLITFGIAVVQSVEQSALKGLIEDTAIAKKNEAIKQLQALCDAHGIKVDLATMDTVIEALLLQGVHQGLGSTTVVSTTVTPQEATIVANPKG